MYLPLARISLACAFAALAHSVVAATTDTLVGRSASGDAVYYALLSAAGSVKTVQTRLVYAQAHVVGDIKNVVASVSIEQIDCKLLTRKTQRLELYTSLDPAATPAWTKDLDTQQEQATPLNPAAPTASTIVFREACAIASTTVVATAPSSSAVASPSPSPSPSPAPAPAPSPTQSLAPESVAADLPTPARPVAPNHSDGRSPANYRPFPDSVFTLGTMGLLAEYVYYDPDQNALLQAESSKMQRGRERMAEDGKPHPILDEAARRLATRAQAYGTKMDGKASLLAAAGLTPVPLPVITPAPPAGFRAELYKHQSSGELILVFRGTAGAMDWISDLWTGVDLLTVESPHYQAAYRLVAELNRRGMKPLVVGHSLGGGMSQYVGAKFGLKVVGFNSAPLPMRYFKDGEGADPRFVRLFSAIETLRRPGAPQPETMPDPVSIVLPDYAAKVNLLLPNFVLIKGHYLLSKPICVKSAPVPTESPEELAAYAATLQAALSADLASTLIAGTKGKVADKAAINAIKLSVRANMADPVWSPDHAPGVDNARVAKEVRAEVTTVAIEQYQAAGGMANIVKSSYNVTSDSTRDVLSGLGSFAKMAAKMERNHYIITHLLQPHSMERFNRGMHSDTGVDVFLADPIRAQCKTFENTN
jgi:hypothetical protein